LGFRDKIRSHIPKVALDSITTIVAGNYKSGKTRLVKEVTELHYQNPANEVAIVAFEIGYETWEFPYGNLLAIHEEGSGADEWKVWEYWKKVFVPGLVEEAKAGKRITKLVCIDTADRYISACEAWLLYDMGKKYGKTFSDIGDISAQTNGKENGWTLLHNELKKPIDQLKNYGYGIMATAWTKEKETNLHDGRKYNSVELMMHNTGRKVFESQASLICCLYNDVKILDKEGNELEENLKDKKNREVGTKFHETEVMMYFRPTQYISIAGGRYTNLPEKVPYSANNFLTVFEEAVKGQLSKSGDIEQIKVKQEKEKEERVKQIVAEGENELILDGLIKDILNKAKEKGNKENIKQIKEIIGHNGDPNKIESVLEAKEILGKLNNL
jgi:hypothetical protein